MGEKKAEEIMKEKEEDMISNEAEETEIESETEEESEAEALESEDEQSAEKEKKDFFKKKKDKKDEQIEELSDRVKRTMAEFDNFRKRTEKEKAAMFEIGAKSVIEKLLPIVDNFERGFSTLTPEQMEDSFVQGMDKTYKQMLKMLEDLEVAPIEAVGQEFDPNFHNAVMHVDDDEAGDNIVVEEFQKGYTYRGCVVRTSMVKVAN